MPINSNTIVEVNVEMTLSLLQAKQLLRFLQTAVAPPLPHSATEPATNIIADLAMSIEGSLLRQGIGK